MPWRFIIIILIFSIFLVFITFNLDYRCDVSIGFYKFYDVPVFLTVFASFTLGLICTLPVVFHYKNKYKKLLVKENKHKKIPGIFGFLKKKKDHKHIDVTPAATISEHEKHDVNFQESLHVHQEPASVHQESAFANEKPSDFNNTNDENDSNA